jgi:small subunit ribosomal protein S16
MVGAQPSDQVRNLMVKIGIWDKFVAERPEAAKLVKQRAAADDTPKLSKKAAAKAAEAKAEAAKPAPEPEAPAEPEPVVEVAEVEAAPAEVEAPVEEAAEPAPAVEENTEA